MSFPSINPTKTTAWTKLSQHAASMKSVHMKTLFAQDPSRFSLFSQTEGDLLFDYSKNIITNETFELLFDLSKECQLSEAIEAMFQGERINQTENRSVLHTALRNFSKDPVLFEGADVMPDIYRVQHQMRETCAKIHSGEWKGYTGKKIKYIVNIGRATKRPTPS